MFVFWLVLIMMIQWISINYDDVLICILVKLNCNDIWYYNDIWCVCLMLKHFIICCKGWMLNCSGILRFLEFKKKWI
jgi:hypothetical protein